METTKITSGIQQLDQLLDGLCIGDNVVWYDMAGSLASIFCMHFIRSAQKENAPLIYVSFDRSLKNLLEMLGDLTHNPDLTILDCFTCGKGGGSDIFLKYYEQNLSDLTCKIIRFENPNDPVLFGKILYHTCENLIGNVRFVFESLTGMQELWNGEDDIIKFYSQTCPRLFELNTVAYWVIEKDAHSRRLKAHVNKTAQVAVDLSVHRGKTMMTVLKAEKRNPPHLNRSFGYRHQDREVFFDFDNRGPSVTVNLGKRLKLLRTGRKFSQADLARMVGVTASSISQIESNQIYPSLPVLIRIAEIFSVDVSSFFQSVDSRSEQVVFPITDTDDAKMPGLSAGISAKRLMPVDSGGEAEPWLIEIPGGKKIHSHFFMSKGTEIGFMVAGTLEMQVKKEIHTAREGDFIYLATDIPSRWKNPGHESARILWIKIKK